MSNTTKSKAGEFKGMIGNPEVAKTIKILDDEQKDTVLWACRAAKHKQDKDLWRVNPETGKISKGFFFFIGANRVGQWIKVTYPKTGHIHTEPVEDRWEAQASKVQAILLRRRKALDGLLHIDPWRNTVIWDYPEKTIEEEMDGFDPQKEGVDDCSDLERWGK